MTERRVLFLKSVDSTNAYALERFDSLEDGTLVVARTQTAGRGRRGRRWLSPEGGLYATYVAKTADLSPILAQTAVALAVLDAILDAAPGRGWKLKWPNDVCLPENGTLLKVAGILSEARKPSGSNVPDGLAVGIGVNLNATAAELAELGRPATSLAIETGSGFDPADFAENLLERIARAMDAARQSPETTLREWRESDALLGRRVVAEFENGRVAAGTALDIDHSGALILELDDGTVEKLFSCDVSIKPPANETTAGG